MKANTSCMEFLLVIIALATIGGCMAIGEIRDRLPPSTKASP